MRYPSLQVVAYQDNRFGGWYHVTCIGPESTPHSTPWSEAKFKGGRHVGEVCKNCKRTITGNP